MHLFIETPSKPGLASDATRADTGLVATAARLGAEQSASEPPLVRRWSGNLLKLTAEEIGAFEGGRVIVNSGSLSDDLEALDPRNWMAPGLAALAQHLDSLDAAARATGVQLLLEPCSRHILHDAQVAGIYLSQFADGPFGLALNPTALFEPSMLSVREDHLQRIAEALAPRAQALILGNVRLDEQPERLIPSEPGEGVFDLSAVLTACLPCLPLETPVIVRQLSPVTGPASLLDSLARAIVSGSSR